MVLDPDDQQAGPQPDPAGLPERITTDRLRLVLLTPADAADMLAGRRQDRWHPDYPRRDDVDAASMVRSMAGPDTLSWGPRHIVLGHQAVGGIGFFGPPTAGAGDALEVEVGYGVVRDCRGQGVVGEALRALLVETDVRRVRVRAAVAPQNRGSLRLLAGCGFTELRGSDDEGRLVIARPLP